MTDPIEPSEPQAGLVVTQADMNRAADFLESWEPGPEMTVDKLAVAFACHRSQAIAEVVAWLRDMRDCCESGVAIGASPGRYEAFDWASDMIERGDHLGEG